MASVSGCRRWKALRGSPFYDTVRMPCSLANQPKRSIAEMSACLALRFHLDARGVNMQSNILRIAPITVCDTVRGKARVWSGDLWFIFKIGEIAAL